MIKNFYHKPFPLIEIDDEYCLREQSLEDTEAFLEYYGDHTVSRYILASTPKNLNEAMNELHYCRNLFYQKGGIYWSIARKSDNRMVGAVGLYINNQHNRAEICYDLHKAFWRRGIMKRALKQVTDFAFEHIGVQRVEGVTVKNNIASMAILERIGFVREGTLRNYRQYNGRAHDIELFAITPALFKTFQQASEKETAAA